MEKENKNVETNNDPIKNDNKKKNNTNTILIVVIVVLALIIIAGGIGAFFAFNNLKEENNVSASEETNKVEENTTKSEENKTEKTVEENKSSEGAKVSTKEEPLKLGEWGLASKYVSEKLSEEYKDTKYTDVPVRVTKVTRGEEATSIVKKWFDNQKLYKYEDPKAYTEWAVIDYQVDLSKLTFDEGTIGTAKTVDSDVKGMDGLGIKYNDISYIVSTKDITDRDYVKEPGVYDCQFIVTIPQGCTDYLVKLGNSYNGSESFFKCE